MCDELGKQAGSEGRLAVRNVRKEVVGQGCGCNDPMDDGGAYTWGHVGVWRWQAAEAVVGCGWDGRKESGMW